MLETVRFARLFSKEQNKNRTLFERISSNLQSPGAELETSCLRKSFFLSNHLPSFRRGHANDGE